MKTIQHISLAALMVLFLAGFQFGCSSSNTSATVDKPEPVYGYTNLLQMLRKEPGLRINGSDNNPAIRVNGGGRSISGSSEPLFVVDGAPVGNGYISVRNLDVNTVRSIDVLSPTQAAKYGARAGMGVIEIKTKVKN